jgi:ubiquinone/menaquinone biosynthesis C-methylase UbiE
MTRELVISKEFTNITLNIDHINSFYVRTSLFDAIKLNLHKFNGVLLDVGCGIMPYKEIILEAKKVRSYIGLDFEEVIYPEYELGKPDLFWTGETIPLEDNSVDTILATEYFEHCPHPERIMKEMLRVLRPGGILFFTVPFLWNLHIVPYDEYRYTPFSLKRHLSNANFTNIELSALGGTDASLAQMMGIWLKESTMGYKYKKLLSMLFIPIMKRLIKRDTKVNKEDLFRDGVMITGISGTAYKSV